MRGPNKIKNYETKKYIYKSLYRRLFIYQEKIVKIISLENPPMHLAAWLSYPSSRMLLAPLSVVPKNKNKIK